MAVNAAPSRLRRLIHPVLWLSAARGVAAVLIVTAIVVPLVCLSWTMLAIFAAITVGLNVGLWAAATAASPVRRRGAHAGGSSQSPRGRRV
jgi:hypothetical protein